MRTTLIFLSLLLCSTSAYAADWGSSKLEEKVKEGNVDAMLCLSDNYALGLDIRQDFPGAIKLLHMAADRGDSEAQFNLGSHYQKGDWGLEKDPVQAFTWFHKAAEGGHSGGQMEIGEMYREGKGIKKDDALATDWLMKAAQQGHPGGEFLLGLQYEAGAGVQKDPVEAYKWLRLGIKGGADHPNNQEMLNSLTEKLSTEQIEEGNRRIAEFKPKWVTKTHEAFCRSLIWPTKDNHN